MLEAIAVYSVKHSSDWILELMATMYEHHLDCIRNMEEKNIYEQFFILVNGPISLNATVSLRRQRTNTGKDRTSIFIEDPYHKVWKTLIETIKCGIDLKVENYFSWSRT